MLGAGPPRVFGEPRPAPRAFVAWIRAAPTRMMNHVRTGEHADPQDPVHGGEVPSSRARPLLVAGPAFSPPEIARRLADATLPRYRGGRPDLGFSRTISGKPSRLLSGDASDFTLKAAYAAALEGGGRRVLLGGTGQKCASPGLRVARGRRRPEDVSTTRPLFVPRRCLAVAEGRADLASAPHLQNPSTPPCQ